MKAPAIGTRWAIDQGRSRSQRIEPIVYEVVAHEPELDPSYFVKLELISTPWTGHAGVAQVGHAMHVEPAWFEVRGAMSGEGSVREVRP